MFSLRSDKVDIRIILAVALATCDRYALENG